MYPPYPVRAAVLHQDVKVYVPVFESGWAFDLQCKGCYMTEAYLWEVLLRCSPWELNWHSEEAKQPHGKTRCGCLGLPLRSLGQATSILRHGSEQTQTLSYRDAELSLSFQSPTQLEELWVRWRFDCFKATKFWAALLHSNRWPTQIANRLNTCGENFSGRGAVSARARKKDMSKLGAVRKPVHWGKGEEHEWGAKRQRNKGFSDGIKCFVFCYKLGGKLLEGFMQS
jgi:hypothetical protein